MQSGINIPIWVYILVAGLGLVLGGILIFMHARAVPQPGQVKGATPQLIFGILSLVLLVLVPLVLMIIALTQGDERDRRRDRGRGESSAARDDGPGDMTWLVEFTAGGVGYRGQFEPRDGRGPLKIISTYDGQEVRVRQDCTLTGEREVRITCRDPRILVGNTGYTPDNFDLRWDGEDRMTGTLRSASTAPATFRRGTDPDFEDDSWDAAGTAPEMATEQPSAPATGGSDGALAAQLAAAAEQQRSRLPVRNGPTTITQIEASGTTLNLWVTISRDLSSDQWSQLEQVLRGQTCNGPFGNLIRSGASIGYQMLDSADEQRTLSVSSC